MKKLFIILQVMLFTFILSSCGGQKNAPENQSVTPPATQGGESSSEKNEAPAAGEGEKKSDEMPAANSTSGQTMTGSEVIDFTMSKLTRKINLKAEQVGSIKGILTKKFVEKGEDVNKKYMLEESKVISKDLLLQSHDAILTILEPEQKAVFVTLGQH
jgi:hypothetical protein